MAARVVLARTGERTFCMPEVIEELRRRGSGYAERTIRTMISSHMCSNAPDNAGTTYDDFVRVERGRYRFRREG